MPVMFFESWPARIYATTVLLWVGFAIAPFISFSRDSTVILVAGAPVIFKIYELFDNWLWYFLAVGVVFGAVRGLAMLSEGTAFEPYLILTFAAVMTVVSLVLLIVTLTTVKKSSY